MHCAWNENVLTNSKLLLNAIELAKIINCKGFLTIGTFEEYGELKNNLLESQLCNPKV